VRLCPPGAMAVAVEAVADPPLVVGNPNVGQGAREGEAIAPLGPLELGPNLAAWVEAPRFEGRVRFREVVFSPGPFVERLTDLLGVTKVLRIQLDVPVHVAIDHHAVRHTGLVVSIGPQIQIEIAGSVGFNQELDLTARLPVTPRMMGSNPLVNEVLGGLTIDVPIGGTLRQPTIDHQAFGRALAELGKDVGGRAAVRGTLELLRILRDRQRQPDRGSTPPRRRRWPSRRR